MRTVADAAPPGTQGCAKPSSLYYRFLAPFHASVMSARAAIDEADEAADADTADIFTAY